MLTAPTLGIWLLPHFLCGMERALMDLALNRPFVEALAERLTEWYEAFWTAALDEVGPWVDLVHSECFGLVESTSAGVPLWTHLARRSPSARDSASSAK